ncbi:MAG: hypothetical protein FJW30_10410 [Acidobacteria bacterium]|nr:hypothetical protein [Acidobacteriota bacterium]
MRVTLVRLRGKGPARDLAVHEQYGAATRRQGWERATGDVVAFLDDRYDQGPEWLAAAGSGGAVGGVVLPGDALGYAGWLYYVIEYGWRQRLAAGNIAYPKPGRAPDEIDPGPARLDPRMAVRLIRYPSLAGYVRERFEYSKAWGARHVSRPESVLRLALPFLLLARTPWWKRPAVFPGVVVMSVVMAVGEIAGSWSRRSVTLEDS